MHSSTLDHRTRFFEPCKTIFPLLSLSPRLERIRRVGGGEEGKVETRRIGRARVKSSRRFELFRGGVSNDTGGRKFAPKEARRTTKKWKKRRGAETRSGEDARVPRVCQLEMFARDQPIPRPRRHVLDFFARNSNRVLMQRRGNKNSIFLG